MIQLISFQEITAEFDDTILQKIINELYAVIAENAQSFRLLVEFESSSLAEQLYKHSIRTFFMYKGFKVVNFNGFMFIDWSYPNIDSTSIIKTLPSQFTSEELYLYITHNTDFRRVSYRPLIHRIETELKKMRLSYLSESIISLDISTVLDPSILNNLFAADLLKINMKHTNIQLTFMPGGLFKITDNTNPIYYTDVPYNVMFGTKQI